MTKQDLFDMQAFAEQQALWNEPIDKVIEMYNDTNRLPQLPAQVIID